MVSYSMHLSFGFVQDYEARSNVIFTLMGIDEVHICLFQQQRLHSASPTDCHDLDSNHVHTHK